MTKDNTKRDEKVLDIVEYALKSNDSSILQKAAVLLDKQATYVKTYNDLMDSFDRDELGNP